MCYQFRAYLLEDSECATQPIFSGLTGLGCRFFPSYNVLRETKQHGVRSLLARFETILGFVDSRFIKYGGVALLVADPPQWSFTTRKNPPIFTSL